MPLSEIELKALLDRYVDLYNQPSFIAADPVSIPHRFIKKEDREIAGYLAATISWGNRKSILSNCDRMMTLMGNEPHEFILNFKDRDLRSFDGFVHRTFNAADLRFFMRAFRHIYDLHGSIESAFTARGTTDLFTMISSFRKDFLSTRHAKRSEKHISDPARGSSAKRICMYLRWMCRKDHAGVDLGIWKKVQPSKLMLPLDVHTGNISRKLGILKRRQNDWKAVEEVTDCLRKFDPSDPVRYDYALFGMGVNRIL